MADVSPPRSPELPLRWGALDRVVGVVQPVADLSDAAELAGADDSVAATGNVAGVLAADAAVASVTITQDGVYEIAACYAATIAAQPRPLGRLEVVRGARRFWLRAIVNGGHVEARGFLRAGDVVRVVSVSAAVAGDQTSGAVVARVLVG